MQLLPKWQYVSWAVTQLFSECIHLYSIGWATIILLLHSWIYLLTPTPAAILVSLRSILKRAIWVILLKHKVDHVPSVPNSTKSPPFPSEWKPMSWKPLTKLYMTTPSIISLVLLPGMLFPRYRNGRFPYPLEFFAQMPSSQQS